MDVYKNLSLEDLPGEVWKDIEEFPNYQVSNMGRVKSLSKLIKREKYGNYLTKEKILKPRKHSRGYLEIQLPYNNKYKNFYVHRLVAKTFIPNPENKPQVNHINEIKTDNRVCNLNWMTAKENTNHGTKIERVANKNKGRKTPEYVKEKISKANINNVKTTKPVFQFSLDGQFIKEWISATEAGRNGYYNNRAISACCLGKRKTHKGYIWKYK